MRLEQVLAPVDFSDGSHAAARLGLSLARSHDGTLTLLHVDDVLHHAESMSLRAPEDLWKVYLDARAERLKGQLSAVARAMGSGRVRMAIAREDAATAIVDRAASDRSDLVVLGARGARNTARAWVSSVGFEVVARAICPVLVARDGACDMPADGLFRTPLVAVLHGTSPDASIALARALCVRDATVSLAILVEPVPELAHASEPGIAAAHERARADIEAAAAAHRADGVRPTLHWLEGASTGETVLDAIERNHHDLVVVTRHSSASLAGSLGPAARRLLDHSSVSVAILSGR